MTLPLTKTMSKADWELLIPELHVVDRWFTSAEPQTDIRRWEYAMALRALSTLTPFADQLIYDVGGAGSPFGQTLVGSGHRVQVVDPNASGVVTGDTRLSSWCGALDVFVSRSHPHLADAVFCLSVLEHVDDVPEFLYHLGCLVAPGGLLFLTMDCRENEVNPGPIGPPGDVIDDRHFHWMRKRIFTPLHVLAMHQFTLHPLGFNFFGGADFTYHGHQVYGNYSFASLAIQRRA